MRAVTAAWVIIESLILATLDLQVLNRQGLGPQIIVNLKVATEVAHVLHTASALAGFH